ncbi:hypothetical protein B0H21DRAFT_829228 [Amylocystis lapponica]|nr:hypothetical protein B0H21DRAFT_829228 [Amylocystis lapponica]
MPSGGLGTSIAIGIVPEYVQFQKFEAIVIVWIVGAMITDIVIAVSLKTYKSEVPTAGDLMNKIMRRMSMLSLHDDGLQ